MPLEKKLARINFWAVTCMLMILVTTGADDLLLETGDQLKRNTTRVKRIVTQ